MNAAYRLAAVSDHGMELRWQALQVVVVPAGIVERHAEAEDAALADLGDAFEHLAAVDQVEPPALVVGAERAPVRPRRTDRPSLWHRFSPCRPIDTANGLGQSK